MLGLSHRHIVVWRSTTSPLPVLVMSTVSPYIKAGDVDLVFKLRLKDGLTAVQLSKIPKQLLGESEVDRFLRVTAVTSQKASLSLYQSRARAVDDNRGELLAPMVSAATLSHLNCAGVPTQTTAGNHSPGEPVTWAALVAVVIRRSRGTTGSATAGVCVRRKQASPQ